MRSAEGRVYCLPVTGRWIRRGFAASVATLAIGSCLLGGPAAPAAAQPVELAAPYEYHG
jgi:hypothetical protein